MVDGPNGNSAPLVDVPPMPPPIDSLRTAEDFRAAASILYNRWNFLNQAGITFGGLRDFYAIFGYKRQLSITDYRDRYDRGGLAGALIDIMPDATWRGTVEVREDKDAQTDTEFERAWKSVDRRLQVQAKLLRVDKLSRLSNYAVLLIGVKGDATLDQELPRGTGPDDVIFLQPFTGAGGPGAQLRSRLGGLDADCTISEYETDVKNLRFGMPKTYQLKRLDLNVPDFQRPVHWSRILHIAEGVLDNDVFGKPALERSWNHFDDLDKITGGGAEAFWLRANAGMHLDVDKDMAFAPPKAGEPTELEKLKQQAEDYAHQMTRMMRTRGVTISQLGSDVANFSQPADAIITQIAGANRIPKRILTGSEMGELASSQDRDNWKDQVNGRQTSYAGPYILRPLVDRLIAYGYLPAPSKGPDVYDVVWPHVQTLTEQEKAEGAKNWASTNQTQGAPVFTATEIRDKWYSMPELTEEQIAEATPPEPEPVVPEPIVPAPAPLIAAMSAGYDETLRALEAAIERDDTEALDRIIGVTHRQPEPPVVVPAPHVTVNMPEPAPVEPPTVIVNVPERAVTAPMGKRLEYDDEGKIVRIIPETVQ
jgi:uncharacterized protein